MSAATSRPRKTLEDYLALPDDVRAELIEGELYVTPSPTSRHQSVVPRIWQAIQTWAKPRRAGVVHVAPLDVHLPSGDVVQPDVLFIRQENLGILREWVHGTPDLLMEVVSAANPERDRGLKRALYARNGVPEYWIVDPGERSVEVLCLAGAHYAAGGYFEGDETLTSPGCPGLRVHLADIFSA